jgi:hypothetical protein
MANASTGTQIKLASSITTATAFDNNWLFWYLRPKECGHDNSKEFMGIKFQEMLNSYGIKSKPMTVKNTMAKSIIERIQGTLGEQLRATIFGGVTTLTLSSKLVCMIARHVTCPRPLLSRAASSRLRHHLLPESNY